MGPLGLGEAQVLVSGCPGDPTSGTMQGLSPLPLRHCSRLLLPRCHHLRSCPPPGPSTVFLLRSQLTMAESSEMMKQRVPPSVSCGYQALCLTNEKINTQTRATVLKILHLCCLTMSQYSQLENIFIGRNRSKNKGDHLSKGFYLQEDGHWATEPWRLCPVFSTNTTRP